AGRFVVPAGRRRAVAGSIYYPPSQREWEEGDRGVRCFLWSDDRKLTRSMRDVGPEGLPAI
ncbi:hypothetical protein ABZ749_26530, partial [Micromonospora sp. NPDC047753]